MLNDLLVFFYNTPATPEIYTLSLHDALPISSLRSHSHSGSRARDDHGRADRGHPSRWLGLYHRRRLAPSHQYPPGDRKSTRLNSSHSQISYAVFCLKKKKKINDTIDDAQTKK